MDLRAPLRWARACAFEWTGANRRARRQLDGSRAAILMYHRVIPRADAERDAVEPGMYVTPRTFHRHLEWLETYFRVLPLHEIVKCLQEGRSLPGTACAITFDDGWRDNHDFALPELERRGLPATIFVVSKRVGTMGAFWPDEVCGHLASLPSREARDLVQRLGAPLRADPIDALLAHMKGLGQEAIQDTLVRLRMATGKSATPSRQLADWEELDRLASAGIDVESHGATHAILTTIPEERVRQELHAARESLLERGHGRHGLLAYPSGAHDERVRRMARSVGYAAGFAASRGLAHGSTDLFALPRVGLHDDISRTRVEFLYATPGRK